MYSIYDLKTDDKKLFVMITQVFFVCLFQGSLAYGDHLYIFSSPRTGQRAKEIIRSYQRVILMGILPLVKL